MVETKIIEGIECYEENGVAYLNLEAVARGLGFTTQQTINGKEYSNIRWKRVDEYLEELDFATCGKRPDFIPENIFYRLAMKAKNPVAEAFQAKVADEIIPAIRRTGGYVANDELFVQTYLPGVDEEVKALFRTTLMAMRQQSRTIQEQGEKIGMLEERVESQRQTIADYEPKVEYMDLILSCPDTVTTTQIAADYDISANKLNKILCEDGLQRKVGGQWILYRRHMGKGYTKSETHYITHEGSNSKPKVVMHTKWTQKGRLKIYEILKDRGFVPVMDRAE